MKRFFSILFAAVLTICTVGSSNAGGIEPLRFRSPQKPKYPYKLTIVPTPASSSSFAAGVNGYGQVVGWMNPVSELPQAFLFTKGKLQNLDLLIGGAYSYAYQINEEGLMLGTALITDSQEFAFTSDGNSVTNLSLKFGLTASSAGGINDKGVVVGVAQTTDSAFAFRSSNGVLENLYTIVDKEGFIPSGINNAGDVVGETPSDGDIWSAFILSGNNFLDLGTLLGGNSSRANDINNNGVVVGHIENGDEYITTYRGFTYFEGSAQEIGPAGMQTYAIAINDNNEVVGWFQGMYGPARAFICKDGSTVEDLNALVDSPNLELGTAMGINNRGQIVGAGTDKYGDWHAYLLTPVNSK